MSINTFFRLRLHIFGRNDGVDELLGLQIAKDRSKYNILWTNTLSDFGFAYPGNVSELRSFNCDQLLWQFLGWRYLLKKSSIRYARNTVLLFTDNEALFPLAVFFASLYKQNYLLGWWYGLISNWFRIERFMDARDTRWRYNYRNNIKVTIAFFLDVVTKPGLVFIEEFRRLSTATLCIGLTDTLDVLNSRFLHIFTPKAISHLYFYLTFWFKLVVSVPADNISLEMGVVRTRPEACVVSAIYKKQVLQTRRKLSKLPQKSTKAKSLPKKSFRVVEASTAKRVQNINQQSKRMFSTVRSSTFSTATAAWKTRRRKRPFVTRNLPPHSIMGGIRVPKIQHVQRDLIKGKIRWVFTKQPWSRNATAKWRYWLIIRYLHTLLYVKRKRLRSHIYKNLHRIGSKITRFDFVHFIKKHVLLDRLKIRYWTKTTRRKIEFTNNQHINSRKAKRTVVKVLPRIRFKGMQASKKYTEKFNKTEPYSYIYGLRSIWGEWREYRRFRLLMRLNTLIKAYKLWYILNSSKAPQRVIKKIFYLGTKKALRKWRLVVRKSLINNIYGWRFKNLFYSSFFKRRRRVVFSRNELRRLYNCLVAVSLIGFKYMNKPAKKMFIRKIHKNKAAVLMPIVYLNKLLIHDRLIFSRAFNRFEFASNELLISDVSGSVKDATTTDKNAIISKKQFTARQEFFKELRFYRNKLRFKKRSSLKRFLTRNILLRSTRDKRILSKRLRIVGCGRIVFWDRFKSVRCRQLSSHLRVLYRLRTTVESICCAFISMYVRCYRKQSALYYLFKKYLQLQRTNRVCPLKFKRLRRWCLVRYFKDLSVLSTKLYNLRRKCQCAERFMRFFLKRIKLSKKVVTQRRKALNKLLRSRLKSIKELSAAKNMLYKAYRHRIRLYITAKRVLGKIARIEFKTSL